MKKVLTVIGGLALVAVVATGCTDKTEEPFNDAPRVGQENNVGANVIMFPDGFSNGASKCDHGNRVYVVYKGDDNRAAIGISPQDPTCDGNRTVEGEG